MFAPGKMRTRSARLVGRQAQIMAIWHSITDQWFRGSISTGRSSALDCVRDVGSGLDLQVGFVLEVFREKITTRTIPIAVNLSQCQHAHSLKHKNRMKREHTPNPSPT